MDYMKNEKLRKIQIVLTAALYALSCLAAYHCNQAKREPITRKAVALFDGLLMLGTLIGAYYLIKWIAAAVRRAERSGVIVGAASGGRIGAQAAGSGAKSSGKAGGRAGSQAAAKSKAVRGFKPGCLYMLFEEHGMLKIFLVLFAIGLFFACLKYPGIESGGMKYAYQQVMGMDTLVRDLAPVKYPGSYITGQHPAAPSFCRPVPRTNRWQTTWLPGKTGKSGWIPCLRC